MARRIFLHIGTMKSGTTYLQDFCDRNVDRLSEHGLLWNRSDRNFLAFDDLLGSSRSRPGVEGAWTVMSRRLCDHVGDALISNELLAAAGSPRIEHVVEALQPAEIHLVVTARDLARVLPSQWETAVRNRHTVTWREFVTDVLAAETDRTQYGAWFRARQHLPSIFHRWERYVDPDRITLVTVPQPGASPAVLAERFYSVLGFGVGDFEQPQLRNSSLGAHSAELVRRINVHTSDLDWHRHKWAVKNALARQVLETRSADEPALGLSPDAHSCIRSLAMSMVEVVRKRQTRVVGDLQDLIPPIEPPQASSDPGEATADDLLAAAIQGLEGMSRIVSDLRIEYDSLARLARQLIARDEREMARDADLEVPVSLPSAVSPSGSGRAKQELAERIQRHLDRVEAFDQAAIFE